MGAGGVGRLRLTLGTVVPSQPATAPGQEERRAAGQEQQEQAVARGAVARTSIRAAACGMASGVRSYGLLSVQPMDTARKMVESRLATPRPDHAGRTELAPRDRRGGVRSLHGERLLLLYSRYLTPGVSVRWVRRLRSLGHSGGTVPASHRLPSRLRFRSLTVEAPCLLDGLYHPRRTGSN